MKTTVVGAEFPVVCVGGSAGGLDAYTRLLRHMPTDMGVAIDIVNHLRTVATHLHQILPRSTNMPVELITDRLIIQPNHVFIIPEQRDLHVLDGEFRLEPISKPRGWPDVITVFLRSHEAWVFGSAKVCGRAQVLDQAQVFGSAQCLDDAEICHTARVFGKGRVYDHARISARAEIFDNAQIHGTTEVGGKARIFGNVKLDSKIEVTEVMFLSSPRRRREGRGF
jgi:hypothetical protein